jgi:cytochrome c peroxidase
MNSLVSEGIKKEEEMSKFICIPAGLFLITSLIAGMPHLAPAQEPADEALVELGKAIFFDVNLSMNRTQSCASCHAPEVGFTGPDSEMNAHGAVEPGAVPERFGNRKPPTAAYGGESPLLYYDEEYDGGTGSWIGGMFWDGRATGWMLGDPLAEQAMGPFLNPLEMNMPAERQVCVRVAHSDYARLFEKVWGPGSLNYVKDTARMYERIARSIAAYERSYEVNPFTSKFDLFWGKAIAEGKDVTQIRAMGIEGGMGMGQGGGGMGGGGMGPGAGGGGGMGGPGNNPAFWENYRELGLSDEELQGLAIFNDPNRANCASCHSLTPGLAGYPLFTDFSYHNLGIPKNPENPYYSMPKQWNPDGADWIDYGLGGYLMSAGYEPEEYEPELGKFKTPTMRNVDLRPSDDFVKAYGHNGFFKSLDAMDGIIHFYAWRAMMDNGSMGGGEMGGGGMGGGMGGMGPNLDLFPPPEYDENRIVMQQFNFMMDGPKIMAFLRTLSDGYFEKQ